MLRSPGYQWQNRRRCLIMINLLPPATRQNYAYAQGNQKLLRWILAMTGGLVILGIIGTYGWINLHQATVQTTNRVNLAQANLAKNNLNGTNKDIQTISNDFQLVVKVLSHEVIFSKLLSQMATTLPPGANLTSLNITNTAGGSGLDITAEANNYITATQVQVNLADPANGIFAKADLVSITCSAHPTNAAYPCTVQLRAQFAQNNQFLFINQKAGKP